jgi:hypothetical protein
MVPGLYDIFAVQNPNQNEYTKNNVEVGDIHQPLQETHLLLRRPKPVFGFSLKQVAHCLGFTQ